MIIDAHAHWLPQSIIENAHFFHPGWGDIESHVQMMRSSGIERAVISYPTSDAYLKMSGHPEVARVYNDTVGAVIKKFPDTFIGAAVLPAGDPAEMVRELKRAGDELGFRAVSLASSYDGIYLDHEVFHPVYEEAQRRGLPLFVHAQIVNPIGSERVKDPLLTPVIEYIFDITMCIGKLLMGDVLRRYPEVKFIFANFGGALPFLRHRFDATYQMLRGMDFVRDLGKNPTEYLKNIYVDTGGDRVKANFLPALELLGPEHILWGSDWPAKRDVAGSLEAVRSLDIAQKDAADIIGGNLQRLLHIH